MEAEEITHDELLGTVLHALKQWDAMQPFMAELPSLMGAMNPDSARRAAEAYRAWCHVGGDPHLVDFPLPLVVRKVLAGETLEGEDIIQPTGAMGGFQG